MHDAIAILCLFLRADTIPCKNYDPQSVFTLFKNVPFTVCSKFARCHPKTNLIVLADTCQMNVVMKS